MSHLRCQRDLTHLRGKLIQSLVTWDSSYFADENTRVGFRVEYGDGSSFSTARNITADVEFYTWTLAHDFLSRDSRDGTDLTASLSLIFLSDTNDGSGQEVLHFASGPNLTISQTAPAYQEESKEDSHGVDSHVKTIIIAVSVTLGLLLLGVASLLLWWRWKRHNRMGRFGTRGTRAGGSRKAKPGFPNTEPRDSISEIQLTDRSSWNAPRPGKGGNVFRDEIERQKAMRL